MWSPIWLHFVTGIISFSYCWCSLWYLSCKISTDYVIFLKYLDYANIPLRSHWVMDLEQIFWGLEKRGKQSQTENKYILTKLMLLNWRIIELFLDAFLNWGLKADANTEFYITRYVNSIESTFYILSEIRKCRWSSANIKLRLYRAVLWEYMESLLLVSSKFSLLSLCHRVLWLGNLE